MHYLSRTLRPSGFRAVGDADLVFPACLPGQRHWAGMATVAVLYFLSLGCGNYAHLANQLKPISPLGSDQIRDLQPLDEVTFLVFGDSGTGNDAQKAVAAGMLEACGSPNDCDFALVLGDNIYENGVRSVDDDAFHTKFAGIYGRFGRLDFWVVPGNHDWHRPQSVQAEIDYTRKSNQWRMPANHFALPLLPKWLQLYGLDTTVMQDLGETSDRDKKTALSKNQETQLQAAQADLCGKQGWRLLFGHHAVYSGGRHGYEGGRAVLPAIKASVERDVIEPCDVPVYFSGHDHHQELLFAEEAGYYQVIQGAAGKLRRVRRRHDDGVQQRSSRAVNTASFWLAPPTSL